MTFCGFDLGDQLFVFRIQLVQLPIVVFADRLTTGLLRFNRRIQLFKLSLCFGQLLPNRLHTGHAEFFRFPLLSQTR